MKYNFTLCISVMFDNYYALQFTQTLEMYKQELYQVIFNSASDN